MFGRIKDKLKNHTIKPFDEENVRSQINRWGKDYQKRGRERDYAERGRRKKGPTSMKERRTLKMIAKNERRRAMASIGRGVKKYQGSKKKQTRKTWRTSLFG